jgi:hypothetical protein
VAGGETGREAAIGDPDLAAPQGAEDPVDGGQHSGGQGCLTTVVSGGPSGGEGAFARAHHLDPRGERLDRHQHRFEGARVTVRIVRDQLELWTAFLCLTPTLTRTDPLGPGGHRAGEHPTGIQYGHRLGGGHARRGHGPVRAPYRQYTGHRRRSHLHPLHRLEKAAP